MQRSAHTNRIMAGAPPKEKTSANESKSTPIFDFTFRNLAAKPSKKSNTAATKIRYEATSKFPLNAITIEIQPVNKLQQVRRLGMCFFIFNFGRKNIKIVATFAAGDRHPKTINNEQLTINNEEI